MSSAQTGPAHVLVVEDHAAMANYVTVVLRGAGHIVVGPALTLASAAELARSATIDIALVDIGMSGKRSFAVLDTLAARGIPCVIMSGYPKSTLPRQFRHAANLEKPFSSEALMQVIRDTLARQD